MVSVASDQSNSNPARRFALVIGNNYPDEGENELKGCVNDSYTVAKLLENNCNFKVTREINQTLDQMKKILQDFCAQLEENDTALFYFSGHGYEEDGNQYYVPCATCKEEDDLRNRTHLNQSEIRKEFMKNVKLGFKIAFVARTGCSSTFKCLQLQE